MPVTITLASGGTVRVEPLDRGCGLTVAPDRHDQPDDGSAALAIIRAMAEVRP